jgi:hypothetical protein
MSLIRPNGLAATLDAINAVFFRDHGSLPKAQAEEVAKWVSGRQVRFGRWAGMFAPTDGDYGRNGGVSLFTGEKLQTKLAVRNILTVEAARVLVLFGAGLQGALEYTNRWLSEQCFSRDFCVIGECAHSAAGLMRYLAVGGFADAERRLDAHIKTLARHRDGKGRWKRFPFYYTLLALTEIDLPTAVEELRYAAPACERVRRRSLKDDKYSSRRRAIVQRALAWC